jgi:hypothetical protein
MLFECLLFRHLAATDYASAMCRSYRFFVDLTNAQRLTDLDQIYEVLPSAQVSRASWGQRWGNSLSF